MNYTYDTGRQVFLCGDEEVSLQEYHKELVRSMVAEDQRSESGLLEHIITKRRSKERNAQILSKIMVDTPHADAARAARCPECKGTGEYVGLNKVEPCSRGCVKK